MRICNLLNFCVFQFLNSECYLSSEGGATNPLLGKTYCSFLEGRFNIILVNYILKNLLKNVKDNPYNLLFIGSIYYRCVANNAKQNEMEIKTTC